MKESHNFHNTPEWNELRKLVGERCFLEGRFVLSSGQVSNYYFDCRKITLHPRGSLLIADIIISIVAQLEKESGKQVEAVGGPTLGADPIAATVALRSAQLGRKAMDAFIVRKEPKKHGTNLNIENNPQPGAGVVVVEDVVTTGGTLLQVIDRVEAAGYKVGLVVTVVDRQEGGVEALAEKGFELDMKIVGELAGICEKLQDRNMITDKAPALEIAQLLYTPFIASMMGYIMLAEMEMHALKKVFESQVKLIFMGLRTT